jgi:hypothetical protein
MKPLPLLLGLPILLSLAACGDEFVPREKVAQYDPETGTLELPYPCPDWSHSSLINYDNSPHSNYGCAVNTNVAQQLANPEDIAHGAPSDQSVGPDTEVTTRVIEQYRAGEIPVPLEPIQASAAEGGE